MTEQELIFLKESNNIENEFSDMALFDSILAWQFMKNRKKLTEKTLLHLHRILMKSRPTIPDWQKGKIRTVDVMIGKEIKSPRTLQWLPKLIARINNLLSLPLQKDITERIIRQDHIMFEYIHPFTDGNGRTGRILLNWERLQVGLPILIIKEFKKRSYYNWFKEDVVKFYD